MSKPPTSANPYDMTDVELSPTEEPESPTYDDPPAREESDYGLATEVEPEPLPTPPPVVAPPPAKNPAFGQQHQRQTPSPPPPQSTRPATAPAAPAQPREVTKKFWTMKFYQQFFDVNTVEVLSRMAHSLAPYRAPDFLAAKKWHARAPVVPNSSAPQEAPTVEKYPDLYGPFWVTTTLWILLLVGANIVSLVQHSEKEEKIVIVNNQTVTEPVGDWVYDFEVAAVAIGVVYIYTIGMSLALYGIARWKQVPATVVDTLCLYGYGMFPFALAALATAIPISIVKWIVVAVMCFLSNLYMVLNLVNMSTTFFGRLLVLGCVTVPHLGLSLMFCLYFFS